MQACGREIMLGFGHDSGGEIEDTEAHWGYFLKICPAYEYKLSGPFVQVFLIRTHRFTFSLLLHILKNLR